MMLGCLMNPVAPAELTDAKLSLIISGYLPIAMRRLLEFYRSSLSARFPKVASVIL
jgi:hypothetical protein